MQPIKIFCSYARNSLKDQKYLGRLEEHLANLEHQGHIAIWYDLKTVPGRDKEQQSRAHMKDADIILLFVSPEYMHSDYCHSEAIRAVHMESMGIASVRVLLLRHVDLENAPFSWCQVLPKNRKFVSKWSDRDEAFHSIVEGIKDVVQETRKNRSVREANRTKFGTTLNDSHVITAIPPLPPLESLRTNRITEEVKQNRITEEVKQNRITEEVKPNKQTERYEQRKPSASAQHDRQVFTTESTYSEFIPTPKKKALPRPNRKRTNQKGVVQNSSRLKSADISNWRKRARQEYNYVSKGNRGIYFFSLLIFDLVVMPTAVQGWSNTLGLSLLAFFVSLPAFIWGTINIDNLFAPPLALLYAGFWGMIILHYFSWRPLFIICVCILIAFVHFLLFRKHQS